MKFRKNILTSYETVKFILSKRKYFFISFLSGIALFIVLFYFMVMKIADKSLRIYLAMSGPVYTIESLTSIFLISSLFGIYLSLIVFRIDVLRSAGKKSFLGILGGGIGALGVGCPTCGAFLFGLLGAPLALMSFPLRGAELRIFGVLMLALSVYLITKSINKKCSLHLKRNI